MITSRPADPKHLGRLHRGPLPSPHLGSHSPTNPHVNMIVPGGGISLDGTTLGRLPTQLLPLRGGSLTSVPPGWSWRSSPPLMRSEPTVLRQHPALTNARAFAAICQPCATANGWSTANDRSADQGSAALPRRYNPSCRHLQPRWSCIALPYGAAGASSGDASKRRSSSRADRLELTCFT